MLGLIPRPFIDEVLNRIDLVEFVDGYVPLKKSGHNYTACCPFHNEKTPSFNVVAKKQFYHCFGCGASGNAISFAMNYLHLSFSDAIESLASRIGLKVPREGNVKETQQSISLYQFLNQVANFYQQKLKNEGAQAIAYLKQRGLSGEIAHMYQLGYAPPGWHNLEEKFKSKKDELIATGMIIQKDDLKTYDRYRERIMYPIHDRQGRIIGFGGRVIDSNQKPKYLNSPETSIFQKSRELYGLHQVLQQQKTINYIIIVEGYMDVIALAQHGVLNAVGTLGTATSTYHIQLLSKHTKKIIFCFDGDAAGRQAAWRALEKSITQLNSGLDARFIFLQEGQDPDSLIREEGKDAFLRRLENAISLNKFFIDTITQGIDTKSHAGKSQLINAAKPYLTKMLDGPYKQLLINELARLTRIDNHRIDKLIYEKPDNNIKPNQNITRSPIKVAIALLLQNPEIYDQCKAQLSTTILDTQKQRVLTTLIQQITESPTLNTAKFVELWRDSPIFDSLTKLATWDHQVPENALAKEFGDIIQFLAKQNKENEIQQLIKKTQTEGLNEAERINLQEMLKERHQSITPTIKTNTE